MAYNQKQTAGRGNMPKTGKDIPLNMKSPMYQVDPTDPKNKKAKSKVKDDRGFLSKATDAGSAFVSNFGTEKTKIGKGFTGQGQPGSGSRKGDKDIIEMFSNATKAAVSAYKGKQKKNK